MVPDDLVHILDIPEAISTAVLESMTAVSTLANRRGLNNGEGLEDGSNQWSYPRPRSQEVRFSILLQRRSIESGQSRSVKVARDRSVQHDPRLPFSDLMESSLLTQRCDNSTRRNPSQSRSLPPTNPPPRETSPPILLQTNRSASTLTLQHNTSTVSKIPSSARKRLHRLRQ